jgi:hypothetical protein
MGSYLAARYTLGGYLILCTYDTELVKDVQHIFCSVPLQEKSHATA